VISVFEAAKFDAFRQARRLLARYDLQALRPPVETGPLPEAAQGLLDELRLWCLQPAAAAQPLPVATLQGDDAEVLSQLAARLGLERDGSLQMAACSGAAARWALRLRTKLHDVQPWRAPQPLDAWDSGYLLDSAAGQQALGHFRPRRATLLVAERISPTALQAGLPLLNMQAAAQRLPMRLLVVGDLAEALPPEAGARPFCLGR
jgi:hypothetical protein